MQESRTLEMNNVHDGTWHGRGDTMFIGTYVEGAQAFELNPPSIASINSPKPCLCKRAFCDNDEYYCLIDYKPTMSYI